MLGLPKKKEVEEFLGNKAGLVILTLLGFGLAFFFFLPLDQQERDSCWNCAWALGLLKG